MDILLAVIMIPIGLIVCLFIGAFTRQVVFKDANTKSTIGNNIGNIVVGLIVVAIAFIIFKGLIVDKI